MKRLVLYALALTASTVFLFRTATLENARVDSQIAASSPSKPRLPANQK